MLGTNGRTTNVNEVRWIKRDILREEDSIGFKYIKTEGTGEGTRCRYLVVRYTRRT